MSDGERVAPAARAKVPPRLTRILVLGAVIVLAPVVAAVATVVLAVAHYSEGLPSVEQLKSGYDPPQLTRILARDGAVLADVFTERRTLVSFAEVPDNAKLAFLAAEDASFYEHQGLNYFGMLRALAANLRAGATRQGGSTITQQVVKNVLLDPERTMKRKIRETILALRHRRSVALLLREEGARARAPGVRAARGAGGGAGAVLAAKEPRARPGSAQVRARTDAREGFHHEGALRRSEGRAAEALAGFR